MSSGSRVRTLLVLLGTILAAGSGAAEDGPGGKPRESSDTKASGNWTDPPAKVDSPATNAAAPKRIATPAKIEEPPAPTRAEKRSTRHSAKLHRKEIRKTASRMRIEREVRAPKPAGRRIATRLPPRMAPTLRQVGEVRGSGRPVYGDIAPDAPAEAYYERRGFGSRGPGALGLMPVDAPAYRFARAGGQGRLVMRWRGPTLPFGYTVGEVPPPGAFDEE